jgi:predicted transcriptional regulator
MELDLSPELQAKLDEVAGQRGRDAKSLVKEAVERLVDYDAWFVREVEKGLAEIGRGDVLEHDEVGARLENLLRSKQRRS